MKTLIKLTVAALSLMALALPAMAGSWDVCADLTTDANASTQTVTINGTAQPLVFSAVAPFYPADTFDSSTTSCTTSAKKLGLFFAKGTAVGNLPADTPSGATESLDVFFVDWYFRFSAGGAFSTTGLVRNLPAGSIYRQAITGSFGGRAATTGRAVVTVLVNTATLSVFRITTP
jgi:hypothetical protein